MKKINLLSLLMFAPILVGCNNDINYIDEVQETSNCRILLSESIKTIELGERWKLNYRLVNSTEKPSFISNNSAVASVDEDGYIVGNDIGKAQITASIGDVFATCEISVNANKEFSISIGSNIIELCEGTEYEIQPTIFKGYEVVEDEVIFNYFVYDENVVTVGGNVVTGIGVGSTKILISCIINDIEYYKMIDVKVNPDLYISCGQELNLTFENGNVVDFPEFSVKKASDDTPVAVDITLESDATFIEINNTTKKITLLNSGESTITVSCVGVSKTLNLKVSHGNGQEGEYRFFNTDDVMSTISVAQFSTKQAPVTDPFMIKNSQIGDKHNGETIICFESTEAKATNVFKYPGFYMPPLQSKEKIEQMKIDGYNYVKFDFLKDNYIETVSGQGAVDVTWYFGYIDSFAPGWNSGLNNQIGFKWRKDADLNKWTTIYIPIDNIINNYDDLKTKNKPLFFFATDDNSHQYKLYFSDIVFTKETLN